MTIKNPISKTTLILIFIALTYIWHWLLWLYGMTLTDYCPLTWDVFGYYVYLPAAFDFHDLFHVQHFQDFAHQHPDNSAMYFAGYSLSNGNFVMKYACGNAIMYSPFYFAGKLLAGIYGYPQDGLSEPYRVCMIFCGFFYCFAGLLVLRKVLINFFSDTVTAFVLVAVALATNYTEYSTYTSLLTHNILFFVYSCILLVNIHLYKKFSYKNCVLLGLLLGIAPLIRPTEIVAVFIPLLWGVKNFQTLKQKINSFRIYYKKVILIGLIMGMISCIQLIYWKIVTGYFLFYSYYDQTFDFTSPHFYYSIFSTTNGWLIYSPIMVFALIGIYFCFHQIKFIFWSMLVYVLLHMYFTFSWHIWWYGGSFGLRPMIQAYPMLSIALGCFVTALFRKWIRIIIGSIGLLFFIWLNIFQTYQAHEGIISISHMTDLYYIKIFGKTHISNKEFKYYDSDDWLDSSDIQSSKPLYRISFSSIDSSCIVPNPDSTKKNKRCIALYPSKRIEIIKNTLSKLNIETGNWIAVSFDAYTKDEIYNWDQMSSIESIIKTKSQSSGQYIKRRFMKIPNKIGNNLDDNFDQWGHTKIWDNLTFNFMIPQNCSNNDSLIVSFCNSGSQLLYLNNIQSDYIKIK